VYGPGERHTATDAAGTKVGIVAIAVDALDEAADALGRRTTRIGRDVLRPDLARDVTRTFERAAFGDDPSILLTTVARALSTPEACIARHGPRRLSDEFIVSSAINHVHHTSNWLPSSLTLCRAAGVSERRLQTAFRRMFDTTPTRFFRQRALSRARERLTDADGLAAPVTEIATGLGFGHLSRFSRYYLEQFGELPSETLATAPTGN
jgi:AraC-like DNA-binding protein